MAKKILIADDAEYMRRLIKDTLEKYGYQICGEASDGVEAFEKYKELNPDLIMLDIKMSEGDGITTLKNIMNINPGACCIMCSSMGQKDIVSEAIRYGARDFIVKPFQISRLVEAVNQAIGK